MAPERYIEDASLDDFLIDDSELFPSSTAHLETGPQRGMAQRPILSSHRTSGQPQRPIPNTSHHHEPAPPHVDGREQDVSRAQARAPQTQIQGFDLHDQTREDLTATGLLAPVSAPLGRPIPLGWEVYADSDPAIPLQLPPYTSYGLPTGSTVASYHPLQGIQTNFSPTLDYGDGMDPVVNAHTHQSRAPIGGWENVAGGSSSGSLAASPRTTVDQYPNSKLRESQMSSEAPTSSSYRRTSRSDNSVKESEGSAVSPFDTAPSVGSVPQHHRASIGSQSATDNPTSKASNRTKKLRSASRTSKNAQHKPDDTPEDRRTRASHNLVEKQYRNRLNAQFESLLHALPDDSEKTGVPGKGDESDGETSAERRVSKGEVLERARKHIQMLESERERLERENHELLASLHHLQGNSAMGLDPHSK